NGYVSRHLEVCSKSTHRLLCNTRALRGLRHRTPSQVNVGEQCRVSRTKRRIAALMQSSDHVAIDGPGGPKQQLAQVSTTAFLDLRPPRCNVISRLRHLGTYGYHEGILEPQVTCPSREVAMSQG